MNLLPVLGVPFGGTAITPEYFAQYRWADWDFTNTTKLFQDTAGTTPAVTHNDPVALCVDSSGNGRNLTQSTAGSRPLLNLTTYGFPCVVPDKLDDYLEYAIAIPSGYSIFISGHTVRNSFPGPATFDVLMSSGINGSNNYDRDTYNGFVNTNNNRISQRKSTDTYVNGAPFTNGTSYGTSPNKFVMSGVTDGTAGSNVSFSIFRNTDGAFYGNQPTHRIIVISRACSIPEIVGLHAYLNARN